MAWRSPKTQAYKKMTQHQKVKNRIAEVGYVDNFWDIENYILRLGAIVYQLRKEGMNLVGNFGSALGIKREYWKNYYYMTEEYQKENQHQ